MRIDHVSQPYRAEIAKKVDAAQKKAPPAKVAKGDQAAISQDAKFLSETQSAVETTKLHVANAPDVRVERVEEVKQRIKEGYYNTPEFADKLAGKLIANVGKELGLS
jgi:flagellar biosynthesis anti-sigma factor FlgM